jgi:DNA-binding LacI/PurR family transcriptional regulator
MNDLRQRLEEAVHEARFSAKTLSGLDSLFQKTAATAIIFQDMPLLIAAQQYLAKRGVFAPDDISMVSNDSQSVEACIWCAPVISHIRWDKTPVLRHVCRWADKVARGIDYRRQNFTMAEFVEGGTIGPMPKSI